MGRRRPAPRLRLRALAGPREPSVSRRRNPEGEGLSRVGHARDPLARRLLRGGARVPAGACAVCVRRDVGVRHRGGAGPAVEERPRSRGVLGHQEDEGQGVRAGGEPGRPAARRRGARSAAGRARRQRDPLPARSGGRAGAGRPKAQRTPDCLTSYPYLHLATIETDAIAPPTPPAQAGDPVVQLEGVTVIYGDNRALRNVSARFARGAVGLLGPNGAGKSTMLKALLGFVKPTEGRMTVLGLDVAERPMEIRARLGYMPESDAHIPGMNAVSFVAYCGQLAGLPAVDAMQRAHEVLYYVGLGEARYRNVETYSTGMKQRIKLAQALVHDPDLLFLDEPTNGMDPKGRDEMLELIRDLGHNKNVNLILSSHLLPDVEYTCDDVVVMDKGQVAAEGPIAQLKGPAGRVFELRIKGDLPAFVDVLRAAGMECTSTDEDVMRVFVPDGAARSVDPRVTSDQTTLFALAARHGVQVRHLRPSIPTLEDVFAKALGEQ